MGLPTFIREADGSIVPFDSEQIAHSLFAVSSLLHKPNVLLARELADSVLHFLSLEVTGEPLPRAELNELIVKVVRELGQPEIAHRFSRWDPSQPRINFDPKEITVEFPPWTRKIWDESEISAKLLEAYFFQHIVPADLAAAVSDGYLTFSEPSCFSKLSSRVLPQNGPLPIDTWERFQAIVRVAKTSHTIVIDGLDYSFAEQRIEMEDCFHDLHRLDSCFYEANVEGSIHLNCEQPPDWSNCYSAGNLFSECASVSRETVRESADAILFEAFDLLNLSLTWHLSETDLAESGEKRLCKILERMSQRPRTPIIFDRPTRPILLGPSIQRDGLPCLVQVNLDLVRFVEMLGGGPLDREVYIKKLGSLARLARSVGYFQQDFLRNPRQFRVEMPNIDPLHSYLDVAHLGLIESSIRVLGSRADEQAVLALASQSLATIQQALQGDQLRPLRTRLSWGPRSHRESAFLEKLGEGNSITSRQLRHIAAFKSIPGGRVFCMTVPVDMGHDRVIEALRSAYRAGVDHVYLDFDKNKV